MLSLTTYIEHPEQMTAEVVNELAQLLAQNPAFQTARLLYVKGLHQLQDDRFGAELRKAALCLPDRRVLYHLLEEDLLSLEAPERQAPAQPAAATADRTQTLINSFLEQVPDTAQPRKTHPVDASVDYMAYLMQQPDAEMMPDATMDEAPAEDFDAPVARSVEDSEETVHDPYFTETLAHIYIKQGKYSKAIEIIRRLSLNYPKKNRYFADQIRFLEKLIINERHQKEEKNTNQ